MWALACTHRFRSSVIFTLGINFKSAPLDRVALIQWSQPEEIHAFLTQVRHRFAIDEIFFLQTCNRREFYFAGEDVDRESLLGEFVIELGKSLKCELENAWFYFHEDDHAVKHLFRVASGLDSMVIGETEIMKQLKDQSAASKKHGNTGRYLTAAVDAALVTAKQVRHRTHITKNVVSMASLAYRKIMDHIRYRHTRKVVLVGAGHFIQSILPTFTKSADALELVFVNRTLPTKLAETYGGQALSLTDFLADPPQFDAMITATGAPDALFDREWFDQVRSRNTHDLLVMDAALPADVAADVADLSGVTYFDLDAMEHILAENRAAREAEIPKAEPIFQEGLAKLHDRWLACRLSHFNRAISEHYHQTGERALEHLLKECTLDDGQTEAVRLWTQHLVKKLTNVPILGLKGVAKELGVPAVEAYTRTIADKSDVFSPQ